MHALYIHSDKHKIQNRDNNESYAISLSIMSVLVNHAFENFQKYNFFLGFREITHLSRAKKNHNGLRIWMLRYPS